MTKPETEKLPELPEPFGDFYSDDKCDSLPDVYTADQMRAYALAALRAQGGGATPDAKFPWENFPCYLIDKCEGETVTEESLHDWLADFLKNPRYHRDSAPAGSGEVDGLADTLVRMADNAYCDYIRKMQREECLGWEEKVQRGSFNSENLRAHVGAGELLGRHRALHEAAALLRKLQQGADYVMVPREVVDSIAHCVEKDLRPYFETVVKWHVLIASQGQEGGTNG